ncbi:MAG TPA: aldo/keto reductase [Pseudonocardiaceae bacterium]
MATIGETDLDVFPLCLGGNVFGWTANQEQSFAVLDAYAAAGGNFIDTADSYSWWADGNTGGESETIIGRWLASRGNRDEMVIATKVGMHPERRNLRARTIREAAEESLRRLGTDRIDLYYAHLDDPTTPLEETLGAFDELVRAGKVRYVAASNYDAGRLEEALEVAEREGFSRFVALQPEYNLVARDRYEGELARTVESAGLAAIPYRALASGFLTGKYRADTDVDSPRARQASTHLDERGLDTLDVLDEISAEIGVPVATIALAWLAAQPTVVSVIASARTPEQLADLLPMVDLKLTPEQLDRLSDASE